MRGHARHPSVSAAAAIPGAAAGTGDVRRVAGIPDTAGTHVSPTIDGTPRRIDTTERLAIQCVLEASEDVELSIDGKQQGEASGTFRIDAFLPASEGPATAQRHVLGFDRAKH